MVGIPYDEKGKSFDRGNNIEWRNLFWWKIDLK